MALVLEKDNIFHNKGKSELNMIINKIEVIYLTDEEDIWLSSTKDASTEMNSKRK